MSGLMWVTCVILTTACALIPLATIRWLNVGDDQEWRWYYLLALIALVVNTVFALQECPFIDWETILQQ